MGRWSKEVMVTILVMMMVIGIITGLLIVNEGRAYADYEGEGTPSKPFLIATAEQLDDVRNHSGASFKLISDIDLTPYSNGAGWVPIGSELAPFTGIINGNGHKITKLKITRPDEDNQGLFGYIATTSIITNMALENVDIIGKDNVGGLVGYLRGTISNSYATGSVEGIGQVGGLVGMNDSGTISNSYTTGSVEGIRQVGVTNISVGGLVGFVNYGTISNSYSTGEVSGESYVGGLVGVESYGTISNSYATGSVRGDISAGGLVGSESYGTISNSYATGSVSGDSSPGGLVGSGSYGTISNSYAAGSVSGNNIVGGLVGIESGGIISNSYAIGSVSGNNFVGGLVGMNNSDSGEISNSFYDSNETHQSDTGKGVGKSTTDMKLQITYPGYWDFENIWGINSSINNGYPYLRAYLLYDGNQNTQGDVPVDNSSYSLGVTASVYSNTGNLDRTGYTFVEWNTSVDGSGLSYTSADTLKLAGETTLYAKWTANTYTVSFNAGGGEAEWQTQTKQYDATYGTDELLPTATRTGYTFGGWYTAAGGTGSLVTNTTNVTTADHHTLYAKWLSSNAWLRHLSVSSGALNVPFAEATVDYTQRVTNSVTSVTVTPTVDDDTASVTVNGVSTFSGQSSTSIALNVGVNTITIVVTAEDNSLNTYTITVNREAAPSSSNDDTSTLVSTPVLTPNTQVTATDGKLTIPVGKSGKVNLEDAITIDIPAGTTDKELKLTIDKVLDTQTLLTNKEIAASPIYELLKNFSDNFSKPVTLTFTFDPAKIKSNQRAAVFYYDELKKAWMEVPGGKISGNHITVEVDHFTKFAVLVVDQPTDIVKEAHISDIAGHWAEAAIRQAVSGGIVTGYPDGTMKPNHTVTRAEFVVMLMNTLKPQDEGSTLTFTDSAKIRAWAQGAVAQAVQAGIVAGFDDGTFRPDAQITRTEMAVMLAHALGQSIEANVTTDFADDKDIPAWAKGSVAYMKQAGIVQGKGNNEFAPQDRATRAEAITVLLLSFQ